MEYVESFRDLEVYKLSRKLASFVYKITKQFPKEEKFSLTDQVRRSSRSVGAQIAEVRHERSADIISKLTDADREQQETQHWVEVARDCEHLNDVEANELIGKYKTCR